MTKTKTKKNFVSFTLKTAMQYLGIENLQPWRIDVPPCTPSPFFAERLKRLEIFDIALTERSKELLVDAYCEEALLPYPALKLWKAAPLSDDELVGVVDYLLTPRRAYIDTPMLCVVEAKKDNFEQGLAQSLVEMHACLQLNTQQGAQAPVYTPIFAIVTNGDVWRFYRYEDGQVYESSFYTRTNSETLLGILGSILCTVPGNALTMEVRLPFWSIDNYFFFR